MQKFFNSIIQSQQPSDDPKVVVSNLQRFEIEILNSKPSEEKEEIDYSQCFKIAVFELSNQKDESEPVWCSNYKIKINPIKIIRAILAIDNIKSKINFNEVYEDTGFACIHFVVISKEFGSEIIPHLLKNGADVNLKTLGGKTALHMDCERLTNPGGFVELLLENGADPFLKNKFDETPLDVLGKNSKKGHNDFLKTKEKFKLYIHKCGENECQKSTLNFPLIINCIENGFDVDVIFDNKTYFEIISEKLLSQKNIESQLSALFRHAVLNARLKEFISDPVINLEKVNILYEQFPTEFNTVINEDYFLYGSLLNYACEKDKINFIAFLLDKKADPNVMCVNGFAALHYLCLDHPNEIKTIENLLKYKADPNIKNKQDGDTPLHCVFLSDKIDIKVVQLLADAMDKPNSLNNNKQNPLHSVCKNPKVTQEIIVFLIEKGIGLNDKDMNDCTPFAIACGNNHVSSDIIKFMIEKGAKAGLTDNEKFNSLHRYCQRKPECIDPKIVQLLLEQKGVRANKGISGGSSPIQIAQQYKNQKLVDMLKVFQKNEQGQNALHTICLDSKQKLSEVEKLIVLNIDVNSKDNLGNTALHYANFNNHSDIISCLEKNGADNTSKNNASKTPKQMVQQSIESMLKNFENTNSSKKSQPNKNKKPILSPKKNTSKSSSNLEKQPKKNSQPTSSTKKEESKKSVPLKKLTSEEIEKKVPLKKEAEISYNKQNIENIENAQNIPLKAETNWQENCIVSAKMLLPTSEKFDDKLCLELFSKTTPTPAEIKLVNNWLELSNFLKANQTKKSLNKNVNKSINKLLECKQEIITQFSQKILLFCLHNAIDNIDTNSNIYKTLLEKINILDESSRGILHTVCMSKNLNSKIVQLLLDKGLDKNLQDKFGKMPLHYACENSNSTVEIVELLIKDIDSLEQLSLFLKTATEVGKNQNIINYLEKKIEIVAKETIISKNIVEKKIPTKNEKQENSKDSPTKITRLLKENSNNINSQYRLHEICKNSNITEIPFELFRDVNIQDTFGQTPLSYACANKNSSLNLIKTLRKSKDQAVFYNSVSQKWTFCWETAKNNELSEEIINYLKIGTINWLAVNLNTENLYVLELLLKTGFNINAQDNNGDTLLHRIVKYRHTELDIMKSLRTNGANAEFKNNNGETPKSILQFIKLRVKHFVGTEVDPALEILSNTHPQQFSQQFIETTQNKVISPSSLPLVSTTFNNSRFIDPNKEQPSLNKEDSQKSSIEGPKQN